MSEVELMREIQMKASEQGHRLFRNNEGVGWVGGQVRVSRPGMVMMRPGDVLLRGKCPLHAGLGVGSSDLIGLTSAGRFLAVEVKSMRGRATPGQECFVDMVNRLGGGPHSQTPRRFPRYSFWPLIIPAWIAVIAINYHLIAHHFLGGV